MRAAVVSREQAIAAARVLGVESGASPAAVRQAWRAAARREHPDAGGDPARFIAVNNAYEVLRDYQQGWGSLPPAPSAVPSGPVSGAAGVARPRPRAGVAAALIATGVAEAAVLVGVTAVFATPVLTVAAALAGAVAIGRYVYLGCLGRGAVGR